MKIVNVVGGGTVGHATAEILRRLGHEVRILDAEPDRQAELERLGFPVVRKDEGDVTFICVPEQNVREALSMASPSSLWVIRSTVMVGDTLALTAEFHHHILHLPEFLRSATALQDALSPNYVLIGECCNEHGSQIQQLFEPLMSPIVRVDPNTSEMAKLAANAHLSTLISFWNQIHLLCETLSVNSTLVGKIVSQDPRISTYGAVMHGKPFDGACLPKDLKAIIDLAYRQQVSGALLEAVLAINERLHQVTNTPPLFPLEETRRETSRMRSSAQ